MYHSKAKCHVNGFPFFSICSIAKKNLSGALSSAEPVSPRPETGTNLSFTSVLSPKPVR